MFFAQFPTIADFDQLRQPGSDARIAFCRLL
jgi:hypothetical protein